MKFSDLLNKKNIYLCAGENFYEKWPEYKSKTTLDWIGIWKDMSENLETQNLGLINNKNPSHLYNIKHDLTKKYDLPDNCVDIYQSEDVFEHIEYDKLVFSINEIYRILKPGGLFRLSIPDYNDINIIRRCRKDNGIIIFDPNGGGDYVDGKVINGGHLWFPTIDTVKSLLNNTLFTKIHYLQYYDSKNIYHYNDIDYSKGYISRTPKYSTKKSIVLDCYK